jgi:hypothetical protein
MGDTTFQADQVREDRWEDRLVRLVRDADVVEGEEGPAMWLVEDLLTAHVYKTPETNLSTRIIGEMEMLAFIAAHATPCACCDRNGGRTFEIENHRYCGGCFRASCDTHGMPCRLSLVRKKKEEATPTPASLQITVPQ